MTASELVTSTLSRLFPDDKISLETRLSDLTGWDSMKFAETLVALESRLGAQIDFNRDLTFVRDMVAMLSEGFDSNLLEPLDD